jgi:hypothetical protein
MTRKTKSEEEEAYSALFSLRLLSVQRLFPARVSK